MTDGAPSPYELYQVTRDQIRHENELVNHRLGWFLAVEGFLLAGFLNALALYSTLRPVPHAWIFLTFGLLAIGGLGVVISVTTKRTIGWAYAQSNHAAEWWNKREGGALAANFPRIAYPEPTNGWPRLRTATLPYVFVGIWMVLMVLLILTLLTAQCAEQPPEAIDHPAYSPVRATVDPNRRRPTWEVSDPSAEERPPA